MACAVSQETCASVKFLMFQCEVEARSLLLKRSLSAATPRIAAPAPVPAIVPALVYLLCLVSLSVAPHRAQAQSTPAGNQTSSSTSKLPPPPTIDTNVNRNQTLANVRYDNKYDIYGGIGFAHFNAGPSLLSGSNLGGFDVQGTRWLTPRLGATVNVRGYYGTNGAFVNPFGVKGPFVMEHLGMGGVSFRAKQNIHAALDLHALFGADYGTFTLGLGVDPQHPSQPVTPAEVGFFNNGATFVTALGGSIDLNRSPQLAFRLSPDYLYTHRGGVTQNEFAISVGILYRIKFPKAPVRPRR